MGTLGKRRRYFFPLFCLIAIWKVTAFTTVVGWEPSNSAPNASDSERRVFDQHRVTKLLGMTLINEDGQELGKVMDFVIDLHAGGTSYAVVSSGGVLGLGMREVLVPAPAISIGTTTERTLAVNMRLERWKNAPQFKRKNLAALASPAEARRISQFYGLTENGLSAAASPESADEPGRSGQFSTANHALFLAHEMLGDSVIDKQRTKLGTLSDVLLDLNERKPTFAVLAASHSLGEAGTFAVPVSRLQHTPSHKWQLDAGPESFRHASLFNLQAWQATKNLEEPPIFRLAEDGANRSRSDGANE